MLGKFGKRLLTLLVAAGALLVSSPVVFAAETLPGAGESYIKVIFAVGAMVGAGLAIGLGAIGAGAGIGSGAGTSISMSAGLNPGRPSFIWRPLYNPISFVSRSCLKLVWPMFDRNLLFRTMNP